jgi:hypothetical protein
MVFLIGSHLSGVRMTINLDLYVGINEVYKLSKKQSHY